MHVKHQQVLTISKAFKRSLGKIYRPRYLTGHNDPIHSASDSFRAAAQFTYFHMHPKKISQ